MRDIKGTGLTDGTTTVDVAETLRSSENVMYHFHFAVRDGNGDVAVPATGTVTVKATCDPSQPAEEVDNAAVDLTDRTNWLQQLKGSFRGFDLVVASLEASHTLDYTIHPVAY